MKKISTLKKKCFLFYIPEKCFSNFNLNAKTIIENILIASLATYIFVIQYLIITILFGEFKMSSNIFENLIGSLIAIIFIPISWILFSLLESLVLKIILYLLKIKLSYKNCYIIILLCLNSLIFLIFSFPGILLTIIFFLFILFRAVKYYITKSYKISLIIILLIIINFLYFYLVVADNAGCCLPDVMIIR
jgi:hypothetical protein